METVNFDQAALRSTIRNLENHIADFGKLREELADLRNRIQEMKALLRHSIQSMDSADKKSQRRYAHSIPPLGPLRDPEIQTAIIELRKNGHTYEEIVKELHKKLPDDPERIPSRSTVHRFCNKAKCGRYEEFGIPGW